MGAVRAVEMFEGAKKRKGDVYGDVTFFSANDEWLFLQSDHPNMCPECSSYDQDTYFGNSVRGMFPYLMIIDENSMNPSVHPSCGCILTRLHTVEW